MFKRSISILFTTALAAVVLSPTGLLAQSQPTPAPRSATAPAPPSTSTGRTTARAATARWTEQDYRLGAGDKLRVEVYKQDQISQSLQIRPDGKITLLFVGDIPAAGRTSIELGEAVAAALKEYVNNPVVTVTVQEAVSAQISVIGEVVNNGPQVMNGSLTALQALAKAGGLREFANKKRIHILRGTPTGQQSIPFDYKKAINGDAEPFYLQPGDVIVVP
jgi:polysaccharide export outer membrane protein